MRSYCLASSNRRFRQDLRKSLLESPSGFHSSQRTAMFRALARVFSFFCQKKDLEERRKDDDEILLKDDINLTAVQGSVTKVCEDFGVIDESIYFSTDVVTNNIIPKLGQKVTAIIEEDVSFEKKAIKVDILPDDTSSGEVSRNEVPTMSYRSLLERADYTNDLNFFSVDVVCEGFEPYQGDQIEVNFYINPETQTRKALSVRPLGHKHVYEVVITKQQGRNGMIDDSIFFTLDSLKLPDGYIPQLFDIVNVVAVKNICCGWRAFSMSLVKRK